MRRLGLLSAEPQMAKQQLEEGLTGLLERVVALRLKARQSTAVPCHHRRGLARIRKQGRGLRNGAQSRDGVPRWLAPWDTHAT